MPGKRKKVRQVKCSRCRGKGYRYLIVGPHIVDGGQAVPGGKARYDCRLCGGTGRLPKTLQAPHE